MSINTTGTLICPECGGVMVLRETAKFKWKNGQNRKFYGCSNFPKCNATHGAHPDGSPLGFPAGKETKLLRSECHTKIDEVLSTGAVGKSTIYRAIAEALGMAESEVHFGNFNADQCNTALKILQGWIDYASL